MVILNFVKKKPNGFVIAMKVAIIICFNSKMASIKVILIFDCKICNLFVISERKTQTGPSDPVVFCAVILLQTVVYYKK